MEVSELGGRISDVSVASSLTETSKVVSIVEMVTVR